MCFRSFKRTIAVLSAIIITFQAWSYTITGCLVSNQKAIPEIGVTISDNEGNELGHTLTGNDGRFVINNISATKIVVEATGKGYSPLIIEVATDETDIDLGILNLEKAVDLQEITVTAKSKINKPGKTIVYASKQDKERAVNPLNMLTILAYKAPQIHVRESERTLTIDGEEPQILVNGIKRPMSFISSIKPDAIDKIEFSTMPDVRFGKRYLNIITRKPSEGGWLMADLTAGITTPRYFLSGAAEYTKGKNDFMFYYNGGYRNGRKEFVDEEERYIGGDKDITLGIKGKPSSTLDKYHNLNFYYTHMPSEKSMFSATGTLNLHDNNAKTHGVVTDVTEIYDRTNNRGYSSISPILSLYYNLRTSKKTMFEIDAVGSYSDFDSHRNLSYSTGYDSRLSTTSHTWYFSTEALWKQTLPFAWLNTGISISYSDASNKYTIDGTVSNQPITSTRLKAYTSMSGTVFSIGYNLSAGVAYYKVDSKIVSPDLTASLQKSIGNNLSLSYNFRYNPQMPSVSSYNDIVTPVNELMYHIGNSNLKGQQNLTNSLRVEFQKNKVFLSIQGNIISNSNPLITRYSYQDIPENPLYGFFIETPDNGKSFFSYGADCNIGVSNLWNFLSLSASTGWGHNRLKATETETFTICSWYLGMNLGMYWKGWQLNFTGSNLVPSHSMSGGNTIYRSWPYTSLAIYKNVGKWNFHVSWNNLFSRYGGRYRTETLSSVSPRSHEFRMNDQGNLLEIGVRYQFTTGKLLNKKNRTVRLSGKGENGVNWDY